MRKVLNKKTGEFEDKPVPRAEMKRVIMQANNWNEDQYRKQYDLFKNKLRFFENVQKSRGVTEYMPNGARYHQSPQEVLYKAAKAKLRYGADYVPSQEMQMIQKSVAHSIKKGERIAASKKGQSYRAAVSKIVMAKFGSGYLGGLIGFYTKAQEIVKKITDPVEMEEALIKFAESLHKQKPRSHKDKGAAQSENAYIAGEVYGSDDPDDGADFDLSPWLA